MAPYVLRNIRRRDPSVLDVDGDRDPGSVGLRGARLAEARSDPASPLNGSATTLDGRSFDPRGGAHGGRAGKVAPRARRPRSRSTTRSGFYYAAAGGVGLATSSDGQTSAAWQRAGASRGLGRRRFPEAPASCASRAFHMFWWSLFGSAIGEARSSRRQLAAQRGGPALAAARYGWDGGGAGTPLPCSAARPRGPDRYLYRRRLGRGKQ